MLLLQEALGGSESSSVFKTTVNGQVWVRISGTVGGTITMKESLDNSTFATFTTDDVDQTFTDIGYKLFDVPGGVFFRFDTAAGSADVDIHLSGTGVEVI